MTHSTNVTLILKSCPHNKLTKFLNRLKLTNKVYGHQRSYKILPTVRMLDGTLIELVHVLADAAYLGLI